MRSIERDLSRAEKRAATFAIHRVCNMRRRIAIQSNVLARNVLRKNALSGISFRISLGVHCICCIDKGAILIQVSRVERYNKIGSFGIRDALSRIRVGVR